MPERPQAPAAPAKSAPAKPTATKSGAVAKSSGNAVEAAPPAAPTSRLGWILGWIVAPAALIGAIYGGGVILGAHHPDGWFARSVMWVAGLL